MSLSSNVTGLAVAVLHACSLWDLGCWSSHNLGHCLGRGKGTWLLTLLLGNDSCHFYAHFIGQIKSKYDVIEEGRSIFLRGRGVDIPVNNSSKEKGP